MRALQCAIMIRSHCFKAKKLLSPLCVSLAQHSIGPSAYHLLLFSHCCFKEAHRSGYDVEDRSAVLINMEKSLHGSGFRGLLRIFEEIRLVYQYFVLLDCAPNSGHLHICLIGLRESIMEASLRWIVANAPLLEAYIYILPSNIFATQLHAHSRLIHRAQDGKGIRRPLLASLNKKEYSTFLWKRFSEDERAGSNVLGQVNTVSNCAVPVVTTRCAYRFPFYFLHAK